jgi:CHASE3 domain sensor protein
MENVPMRRSVFVFAVLLLASAAIYAAASVWLDLARLDRLDDAGEAMLRAEESRTIAQGLLVSAINIETATRGFVLYGDPALLTPLEDARRRAAQELDLLRDHVRADPEQLSRLDRATREFAQSLALADFIIERRRADAGATGTGELGERAQSATKSIRALVDEIDGAESQRLGTAKATWKAELRDARGISIAMCVLTLAVVALAALVLGRLRWIGRGIDAVRAGALDADAPEDVMRGVGMHLEGALDAIDRLQTAGDATAAAQLEPLRTDVARALDDYTRATDDAVPDAVHRGALDVALHELARRAGLRPGTIVREAIDRHARPIDPTQARLLYRAAAWAEQVLMRRPRDGELLVGLATTGERAEVRIAGPCAWEGTPNELGAAERRAQERLAAEIAAAGGSIHWAASAGTGRLEAALPRALDATYVRSGQ